MADELLNLILSGSIGIIIFAGTISLWSPLKGLLAKVGIGIMSFYLAAYTAMMIYDYFQIKEELQELKNEQEEKEELEEVELVPKRLQE